MPFRYTGKKTFEFYKSITLFFLFLGYVTTQTVKHWRQISWQKTLTETLQIGTRIVLPLIVVCMLIGMSLSLSIHYLLVTFQLHNQAMDLVQGMIIRDFAPLPVGFLLCMSSGLNLIDKHHPYIPHKQKKITLHHIIPLILGLNCTALLMYTYVIFSFFIGVFIISYYFLNVSVHEYWIHLNETIYYIDFINSLFKTLAYATIIGFITGFYYFDVARRQLTIRTAVSRIITRGLFWLIVISVLFKL